MRHCASRSVYITLYGLPIGLEFSIRFYYFFKGLNGLEWLCYAYIYILFFSYLFSVQCFSLKRIHNSILIKLSAVTDKVIETL